MSLESLVQEAITEVENLGHVVAEHVDVFALGSTIAQAELTGGPVAIIPAIIVNAPAIFGANAPAATLALKIGQKVAGVTPTPAPVAATPQ